MLNKKEIELNLIKELYEATSREEEGKMYDKYSIMEWLLNQIDIIENN